MMLGTQAQTRFDTLIRLATTAKASSSALQLDAPPADLKEYYLYEAR